MMNRKYRFYCNGCEKPDKTFPNKFQDYEVGEEVYNCPKVTEHYWARHDAYGIFTGIYCHECYDSGDSSLYPYRKDEYHDPMYAGERLESEDRLPWEN